MKTAKDRTTHFYGSYPALHELQASLKSLLEFSKDYMAKGHWKYAAPGDYGHFNEIAAAYLRRVKAAIEDDRLAEEDELQQRVPITLDLLQGKHGGWPVPGLSVLEGEVKDLSALIEERTVAALGYKSAVRFWGNLAGICGFEGRLPPDAINSILPKELRTSDTQRPGGTSIFALLGDPVLDDEGLTIAWAGRTPYCFPTADQFCFMHALVTRSGRFVSLDDLLAQLNKDSYDDTVLKHLKYRVVHGLMSAGYPEIAKAITSRPQRDGQKGYGFRVGR
jgi:hypothetical protein